LKTPVVSELPKLSNISESRYLYAKGIYDIDPGLCDVLGNIRNLYHVFDGVTQSIADNQVEQMEATEKQNHQLVIIMCLSFVSALMTLNELEMLIDMMVNMDKQSHDGAAKPFQLSSVQPQENLNETKTEDSISRLFLYAKVVLFFAVAVAVFIVIIVDRPGAE
jgi:hypothetical protein